MARRFIAPPLSPPSHAQRPASTAQPYNGDLRNLAPPRHPLAASRSRSLSFTLPVARPVEGALNSAAPAISATALMSMETLPTFSDNVDSEPEQATASGLTEIASETLTNDLSDEQLRKLYEDEEVERFLKLFAKHVTEVVVPGSTAASPGGASLERKITLVGAELAENLASREPSALVSDNEADGSRTDDWVEIKRDLASNGSSHIEPSSDTPATPDKSGALARFLASKLSLDTPSSQPSATTPFSLASLRLACQRMYLVGYPAYVPLLISLWRLATWEDYSRSAFFCAAYFILWHHNFILPALFLKILYSLFRRRFLPYPSAKELRSRRHREREADALGHVIDESYTHGWLAASALTPGDDFTVMDAWRTFRNITKSKKQKIKSKAAETIADTAKDVPPEELSKLQKRALKQAKKDMKAKQIEDDWKRLIVRIIEEVADLHERVRNIFLWRRPITSRKYGVSFAFLFLITAFTPAHILAKGVYFSLGVAFWFLVPIVLALTPDERARLPSAFRDAPTDAEYAIDIIVQRAAKGERIVPKKGKERQQEKATVRTIPVVNPSASTTSLVPPPASSGAAEPISDAEGSQSAASTSAIKQQPPEKDKWRNILDRSIAFTDQGIRLFQGDPQPGNLRHGFTSMLSSTDASENSFPAQSGSSPGFISLTSTALTFVPVARAADRRFLIELAQVQGIKKTGRLGGLAIRYAKEKGEITETKFSWVARRDELFTHLVGMSSQQWMKV